MSESNTMNKNMTPSENYHKLMLKNIKHDLVNPINAMIGYSELILDCIYEEKHCVFEKDIQSIYQSSKDILTIIQDLLLDKSTSRNESIGSIILNDDLHFSLRTPLSSIIGLSEMILEDVLHTSEFNLKDIQESVQKINHSGKALLRLIKELNKYVDLSDSELMERYYTDLYLKESNIRDFQFNTQIIMPIKTGTVLIVEDEELNLDLIDNILKKSNHKTLKARGGAEALKILKNKPGEVDLILMDLIMPEMNGMELLKEVKDDNNTYNIPVIMLSALDEMERIIECISLGADDFLFKPINRVLLNARMNNSLGKKYFHDKEMQYQEQIKKEQKKTDSLLLNILPRTIADRLKDGETLIADDFECASVLFADLKGFTALSSSMNARDLLLLLNNIFSKFDELLVKHSLEKIKTIGDNYMLAGGIPKPSVDHAVSVAEMALNMINILPEINNQTQIDLEIRIGINSGPVSAGVIGKKKFIYDLWGDTVNVASRMETYGNNGRIHISESTYELLKGFYSCDKCPVLDIPGKGKMQTYYLNSHKI